MAAAEAEAEGWSGGAGAVLSLTPGNSMPVCYHSSFGSHDDLLLLEVDEKLLPDILSNRVTIRGQPDEEAVLCTPSATYAMKFVGTSNSVFLIPSGYGTSPNVNALSGNFEENNLEIPESVASVIKVAPGIMELILAAPRIDKLKFLLNKRPYRLEDELEDDINSVGLCQWQDLIEQIQASHEELKAALRSLSAVEIDGYWRIVDYKSMDDILNMILNNSILYEWPIEALDADTVASVLVADGYPRKIVLHCLRTFGNNVESQIGSLWSLDGKRVCLHLAKRLLNCGKMKLENFMEKWMCSIPSGMTADLSMLEGEVLYEKQGAESWIRAFSVTSLPSTPAMRFNLLFRERPKWEWKDLEPYIRFYITPYEIHLLWETLVCGKHPLVLSGQGDLCVPGLTSEGLLIKYTRRTQPNADVEPVFSAR